MSPTVLVVLVLLAIVGIGVVVWLATSRTSSPALSSSSSSGGSAAADVVAGVGSGLTGAASALARLADSES